MLRYATLCVTLSILLLSALTPVQAQSSTGCASSSGVEVEGVCIAPGVSLSQRVPAKKPCFTCAVPVGSELTFAPRVAASLHRLPDMSQTPGRTIRPDRRPPRA
ncbi:hypothetical protein [Pseudooceanicola nanhaiensis]|uniref:hypothetical protein n=1 Tax=Pseudooceanicola nanhaiensis TaxID=375761 RepID=UPI001CD2CE1C|nr:hypothetical protein [Pseudooceanicola nanhaiensis]MCA0922853.1 hypothetical protein [Pseudooceanicola nanhaiensis]